MVLGNGRSPFPLEVFIHIDHGPKMGHQQRQTAGRLVPLHFGGKSNSWSVGIDMPWVQKIV